MRSFRIVAFFIYLCFSASESQLLDMFNRFRDLFSDANYISGDNRAVLKDNYDFIIVGAGSAGSVVANRLSENKNWSVLLLEAGKDENFFTDVPLMASFQSVTEYNWGYTAEKSSSCCLSLKKHRCNVPRGKALGGTSVVNFLIYTRGNKQDFDDWESYGNPGWGYEDVLKYFIKSENCSLKVETDASYHGLNGYLNVEYPPFHTPLRDRFLKAGTSFGYRNTDPNGKMHIGFSKVQATMQDGKRESAAKAFLWPVRKRPNLHIKTEARVTKILIEPHARHAYGVTFIKDGMKHQIRAKKEVIIAAGAINTPQLLMLAGIGPRSELERFKIPIVQNLKVGYNLQDHFAFVQSFLVNESVTISDLGAQTPSNVLNYILNSKGSMTLPGGAEALAFLKSKLSSYRNSDYPDIELVMGAGGFNGDFYGSLRNLYGVPNKLFYDVYGPILFTPSFSITTVLLKPQSRGRIVLRNSNPLEAPAIHLNYFEDQFDMQVMVEGLKMVRVLNKSIIDFDLEQYNCI